MYNRTVFFIARRYSRSKLKKGFTAFISRVSRMGIFLGVFALVIVASVMNGFEAELKKRILGLVPHVVLESAQDRALDNWEDDRHSLIWPEEVLAVQPYVQTEGLLQGYQTLMPVMLQGIYPADLEQLPFIEEFVSHQTLQQLEPGQYQIVLGQMLARQLGVRVGEQVRVLASEGQRHTPLGRVPAQRNFTLVGTFGSGAQVDEQIAFVHLEDAARLIGYKAGQVTGMRLYLKDPYHSILIKKNLDQQLKSQYGQTPPLVVEEWHKQYGVLFSAVKMEKKMMTLMLSLIICIAAFNALSALTLLIQDKRKDLAILQTLGFTRFQIFRVFILQGIYMGGLGGGLGILAGILVTFYINPLLQTLGIYFLGEGQSLPYLFNFQQILGIFFFTVLLSVLATFYPAWQATQVLPAEALRNE